MTTGIAPPVVLKILKTHAQMQLAHVSFAPGTMWENFSHKVSEKKGPQGYNCN